MLLRIITVLIFCNMTSGCFLTTNALSKKAAPEGVTYLIEKVIMAKKSKEVLYLCFQGQIQKSGGDSYRPMNSSQSTSYISLFNLKGFSKRNNRSFKVVEQKCDIYFKDLPGTKNIHLFTVDRNVECSLNTSCTTFNWTLKKDEAETIDGTYNKNPNIDSYSLHTNELLKELSLTHDIDEAVYDIMGSGYTKDKDTPRSAYYKNKNIKMYNQDLQTYGLSMTNVSQKGAPYLYVFAPFTVVFDIITFPIQIFIVADEFNSHF